MFCEVQRGNRSIRQKPHLQCTCPLTIKPTVDSSLPDLLKPPGTFLRCYLQVTSFLGLFPSLLLLCVCTSNVFVYNSLICYTFELPHFSRLRLVNLKYYVLLAGHFSVILAVNIRGFSHFCLATLFAVTHLEIFWWHCDYCSNFSSWLFENKNSREKI